MWLMLFRLVLLVSPLESIPLTPDILRPDQVQMQKDRIYILDARNAEFFVLDHQGALINQRIKKGVGPGEFQRPSAFHIADGLVYVADRRKRRLIIFNDRLEFQKELPLNLMVRDVLVHNNAFYLLGYAPGQPYLIHKMNAALQPLAHFGETLNNTRYTVGFQTGHMALTADKKMVAIHTFLPRVQIFDLDGRLQKTIAIPGFDQEKPHGALNDHLPNFGGQLKSAFIGLTVDADLGVFVRWRELEPSGAAKLFHYHRQTWRTYSLDKLPIIGPNKRLWFSSYSNTRDAYSLVALKLSAAESYFSRRNP